MKTKYEEFVLQGIPLGVTEEFVPADWTYEDDGKIKIFSRRNSSYRQ